MTAWLLAIGRMLGLGSIAGIRPSLTLAVIGVVSYFDWGVARQLHVLVPEPLARDRHLRRARHPRVDLRQDLQARPPAGPADHAVPPGHRRRRRRRDRPVRLEGHRRRRRGRRGAAWFAQYTKHLSRPKSVPSEAVVTLISAAEDLGRVPRQRPRARRAVLRLRLRRRHRVHLLARARRRRVQVQADAPRRDRARRRRRRDAERRRRRRRGAELEAALEAERRPSSRPTRSPTAERGDDERLTASDLGVRRLRMVEEQIVRRGVRDEDVLAAMRSVPRHLFVPAERERRGLRRHAAAHRPTARPSRSPTWSR